MQEYTLENESIRLTILDYGARIKEIFFKPLGKNLVLSYPNNSEYFNDVNFLGATIGPNANRLKNGLFTIDGIFYKWETNEKTNNLHSGKYGLHLQEWHCRVENNQIIARFNQKEPFHCLFKATFTIEKADVKFEYSAIPDSPSLINLTNHSYFQLDSSETILDYNLKLNADFYTPLDENQIPTGEILKVDGTYLDFKEYKVLGENIKNNRYDSKFDRGLDDNFLAKDQGLKPLAEIQAEDLKMTVYSTAPAFQVYTANNLIWQGRRKPYGGICIEPQYVPNSINMPYLVQPIFTKDYPFFQTNVFSFEMVREHKGD